MNPEITIKPVPDGDGLKPLTEGEVFVKMFLDDMDITNDFQYEIYGLKNDPDNYKKRLPDFYLPRLEMFVEFNGRYNESKEDRARYKAKTKLYRDNNVPCVQLYPDNLGNLKYSFHYKIMKEFDARGGRKKRYLFSRFWIDNERLFNSHVIAPMYVFVALLFIDLDIMDSFLFLAILVWCVLAPLVGIYKIWRYFGKQKRMMEGFVSLYDYEIEESKGP